MRSASAEHLSETALSGPSPLRIIAVVLLLWAVGSTLLVGGLGAWVAICRRWRVRQ